MIDNQEPLDICPQCDEGLLYVNDEISGLVLVQCTKCDYTTVLQTEYVERDEGE